MVDFMNKRADPKKNRFHQRTMAEYNHKFTLAKKKMEEKRALLLEQKKKQHFIVSEEPSVATKDQKSVKTASQNAATESRSIIGSQ